MTGIDTMHPGRTERARHLSFVILVLVAFTAFACGDDAAPVQQHQQDPAPAPAQKVVHIHEIPEPRLFLDRLRQEDEELQDALKRHFPPGHHQFVVMATAGSGWMIEIGATSSPAAYQTALQAIADQLIEAARSPVVSPEYKKYYRGIEQRSREETGGLVVFDYHRPSGRALDPNLSDPEPDAVAENEVVEPVPQVVPKEKLRPEPRSVLVPVVVALLALLLIAFLMWKLLAALRARRRHAHHFNYDDRDRGERGPLGSYSRVSPSTSPRNGTTPRPDRWRGRGSSFLTRVLVPLLLVQALALSAQAQTASTLRQPDTIVVPDISGTIYATKEARRIIVDELRNGRIVRVIAFGDSAFVAGDISSFEDIEAVLGGLPRHGLTRLADAVLFVVEETERLRTLGGRPTVYFISDFDPDDGGNEGLRYLSLGKADSSRTVTADTLNTSEASSRASSWPWAVGGLAVGVLLALLVVLPGLRRRHAVRDLGRTWLVVGDGIRRHQLSFLDLMQRPVRLLGGEAGALLHSPHSDPASLSLRGHVEEGVLYITCESEPDAGSPEADDTEFDREGTPTSSGLARGASAAPARSGRGARRRPPSTLR